MADFKNNTPARFLQDLDNSEYLSIFDDFSDGVLVTNVDGVIVYYNRAMSRIDELSPDNVISRKVTDVYDLDDATSIIMQCLAKRKPIIDAPIYYRTRMGKFANTIHNVMPIFNKNKLVGAICFVRDYHALVETIAAMPLPGKDQRFDSASITFERIIGQDSAFVDAINSARMAAGTPSPVMLFGETGTGKELFARAISNHSSRSAKKFTPVNCAAIPENLLEGILFGTSKGAFTGAVEKAGLFERTNKGTVFLDEVNSMPVGLQSKILRSIQENRVRRVGALKEIEIDLKIISSVNKDPHIAIADGTLRSDLFYRLGVVFIHIVPLRERMEDIGLLVSHFISKHNAVLCKNVKTISDEVMELFKIYNWPGNVRELEHVIEGAMNIVGTDEVIRIQHLQTHFSNWSVKTKPVRPGRRHDDVLSEDRNSNLTMIKSEHEENIIKNTLLENKGNITKTARSLGISRQLLYYKIKKFNISRDNTK
ncbi:MAG: sigma 54-interacting transcriptional regulator [Proteobacteria bacterium]|nr:sigma 54-interacting transcriptional regulator [Pseudomonadota bacterium]MBU1581510.1 sigma 54-interacting transcriptional regulator [Pseudomonadota bacterium]MBU2454704.1 sigma 54-interacting transcriptional regulator [Pseudomonadota bacterium]MBU2628078.1 sigma 54-interacting transcriptional regulator [Pseudomonadota bacterium]